MTKTILQAPAPDGKSFFYHLQAPQRDMMGYLEHLASYGDLVQLGFLPAYFVNHPDYVQQVLVTQASKFHKPGNVKRALKGLVDDNLFSADDAVWRALRKAIQPGFHMRRIGSYLDTMVTYTERTVAEWEDQERVEMVDALMALTLATTNKALFNMDLDDDDTERFGTTVLNFLDHFTDRLTTPLPVPIWIPTPANQQMKRLVATAEDVVTPIIERQRAAGEDQGDLISMLLQAQANDDTGILTDHQIVKEVYNLAAAGYEVTTFSMAFTLYLVATHPDVEAKLLEELDRVLGGEALTMETLNQLTYNDQVVKEAMRLLPVTTVVSRQAAAPVEFDGYRIPKGSQVLVSPWTLHRRDDIYPDPERFDPDRFSTTREGTIPKHAYIPFSTGPRICIGNAFATLQMRAMLATIYQHYRLSVPADYEMEYLWRFNMRPKHGLPLLLEARQPAQPSPQMR